MLRFRRYRVFVACAIVLTILLYHVSNNSQWDPTPSPVHDQVRINPEAAPSKPESIIDFAPKHVPQDDDDAPNVRKEPSVKIPQLKTNDDVKGGYGLPTPSTASTKPQHDEDDSPGKPSLAPGSLATTTKVAHPPAGLGRRPGSVQDMYKTDDDDEVEAVHIGKRPGAYQGAPLVSTSTTVHWEQPTELYPIDEDLLIELPTGTPKPIPSIQHRFGAESPEAAKKREDRLKKVKTEAQRAWFTYKKYAWTHDEVMPVSLQPRDPFCGWAATLVDALDTLWIMGMKDEFEDAVQAVKEIDFTTTPYRSDIPVFETVIRYLGGLLAAYDVSGGHKGQYPVLLHKAVELAEILMGVFDTPNRMPILYYNWKPAFRMQHSRASTSASIAELGSLTMEFTRLAQLTGKNKYYDAVARITDALEEWQSRGTTLDGLFPESVDASGCNRSAAALASLAGSSHSAQEQTKGAINLQENPQGYAPKRPKNQAQASTDREQDSGVHSASSVSRGASGGAGMVRTPPASTKNGMAYDPQTLPTARKDRNYLLPDRAGNWGDEQLAPENSDLSTGPEKPQPYTAKGKVADWDCVPQGLTSGGYGMESFSMGGSQDSTYEYFPKTWLLLGGLEPKYRTLHERVSRGVKKHLLYRPMIEDNRDILFSAKATVQAGTGNEPNMNYEITHLTCFLGGMFGLGGKIFENEDDVEIGKKLADGCVWAYEVMPTGIMAEHSTVLPCARPDKCQWNQTAWYDRLDTSAEWRKSQMEDYLKRKEEWEDEIALLKKQQRLSQQQLKQRTSDTGQEKPEDIPTETTATGRTSTSRAITGHVDTKEQFDSEHPASADILMEGGRRNSAVTKDDMSAAESKAKMLEGGLELNSKSGSKSHFGGEVGQVPLSEANWPKEPVKPISHEEYVASRLKTENIPPGIVILNDPRYILRPEAIESVWYMYRITGDSSWQEKGWRMFEAVIKATRTEAGHSAIYDVASTGKPRTTDNMESFWLAETLKYFYLLFATPDTISLDEWVLNTEAHPFRRPA